MSKLKEMFRPAYRLLQRAAAAAQRPGQVRRIPDLASVDPAKPVYVFFVPGAIVETHYAAHAIIARTLKERGHQVLLVGCKSDYPHCLAMDLMGFGINQTDARRKDVCRRCEGVKFRGGAAYGLPSVEISMLVDTHTKQEIHHQVMEMPADAGQFCVDGFRFGALCGSDLSLFRKVLNQMHVTGENRKILEAYVEGALIAYRATQKLIETYNVSRLIYFSEYSMVLGAMVAALKADVPVTRFTEIVYGDVDHSKIALTAETNIVYTNHRLLDEWPAWRSLALAPEQVKGITDHSLTRLSGKGQTVFSLGHGGNTNALYQELKLKPGRRVLVAYTSSMDEYLAIKALMDALNRDLYPKDQPFASQTAWLRELIAHVETSEDLQLVVRVHPRDGRNKHDDREPEGLAVLRREFSQDYENVRIIWPNEAISSYDLAEIADVAVPGWSNISLELARLGVPTLIAFKRHVAFPLDDVVEWSPTPDAYYAKIRELASSSGRFDQVRYAFRWTNVYTLAMCLNFDDLIPEPDYVTLPPYKTPRVAAQIEDIIVRGASVTEINRRALLRAQTPQASAAEDKALGTALRRIIWFLATGNFRPDDYVLALGRSRGAADLAINIEGGIATLHFANSVLSRRSRIIERLAPLAANAMVGTASAETATP